MGALTANEMPAIFILPEHNTSLKEWQESGGPVMTCSTDAGKCCKDFWTYNW